ncbi:MAG: PqqD family protein [Thermoleophilia bacterium]
MKSDISRETIISQAGNAISREINGEVVLLTPEDSRVHVLDEVGSRIWSLFSGEADVGAIASAIASEYEVTAETAEADIIEFAGKLRDLGVIKVA